MTKGPLAHGKTSKLPARQVFNGQVVLEFSSTGQRKASEENRCVDAPQESRDTARQGKRIAPGARRGRTSREGNCW
jgi:hypothetical protein